MGWGWGGIERERDGGWVRGENRAMEMDMVLLETRAEALSILSSSSEMAKTDGLYLCTCHCQL